MDQNTNTQLNNTPDLNLEVPMNKENLTENQVNNKKPKEKIKKDFLKYLGYALITLPIIILLNFVFYFFDLKQAYAYVTSGKNNLYTSASLARGYDFENARSLTSQAENNFNLAYSKINQVENGLLIKLSPYLRDQLNNLNLVVGSSILVSESSNIVFKIANDIKEILDKNDENLEELEATKKSRILNLISNSESDLLKAQENIDQSINNLDQIDYTGILWPLRNKLTQIHENLLTTKNVIDGTLPFAQILPGLAGSKEEAHYLVIYQNNDRLRPIGGTIGTYALLHVSQGEITGYDLYDAVHLDSFTDKEVKIEPPLALKKYAKQNNWKMQDANWSPDWSVSALKVEWLYKTKLIKANQKEKINGTCGLEDCMLDIDGVIAITPELTGDLLDIVGGITIDEVDYNRANFTRLFEEELEEEYRKLGKTHLRKELIDKITKKVHLKLFDLNYTNWPELAKVMHKNALEKNILIYSKDKELQKVIETQTWSGKVNNTKDDFLMVVDTNLPATRINDNIRQTLDYKITQKDNKLIANLDINYTYVKNRENRKYKNYVRVYVPLGSKLISSEGAKENLITSSDLSKTVFEGYLEVEPGTNKTLSLSYELPLGITEKLSKDYNLYVQKQPGKDIDNVTVNLELAEQIKNYNNSLIKAEKLKDNMILWETDLITDKEFKASIN